MQARRTVTAAPGSDSLHGNAPDRCDDALLIIDMISDFEFEDGEALHARALPAARRIARLADRARRAGTPVVYVNDNFGRWRSSFEQAVAHASEPGRRGADIARLLAPRPDDYFVLKPKHSGFHETTLAVLLEHLGARRLVLTGVSADICVLFTASDAYLHEYRVAIASDAVASGRRAHANAALRLMARVLKAEIAPAARIRFERGGR